MGKVEEPEVDEGAFSAHQGRIDKPGKPRAYRVCSCIFGNKRWRVYYFALHAIFGHGYSMPYKPTGRPPGRPKKDKSDIRTLASYSQQMFGALVDAYIRYMFNGDEFPLRPVETARFVGASRYSIHNWRSDRGYQQLVRELTDGVIKFVDHSAIISAFHDNDRLGALRILQKAIDQAHGEGWQTYALLRHPDAKLARPEREQKSTSGS